MSDAGKVKVRFILPGGGIRATFQIGFIDEMLATGLFEVDKVYGTSAGGLLTPFIAAYETKEAIRMLERIHKPRDVFQPYPLSFPVIGILLAFFKFGMFKKNRLIDQIVAYFQEKPSIYDKCEVVAWDMMNKKERWFTGQEMPIGMRATSALWAVTPPVPYENTFYVDGGVTELLPVTRIIESEDDFDGIYVLVECSKRGEKMASKPKNLIDLMFALQVDSIDQLATRELALLEQKVSKALYMVEPTMSMFKSPIDMDNRKIKKAIQHGRDVFNTWIANTKEKLVGDTVNIL
jgi:predicted acylesterase/phospholipase RssA